jgi:DNA-binding Lrp family transcriptional regulator
MPRSTDQKVADAVGVSPGAVHNRVKALADKYA